jgi:hypothetical protein
MVEDSQIAGSKSSIRAKQLRDMSGNVTDRRGKTTNQLASRMSGGKPETETIAMLSAVRSLFEDHAGQFDLEVAKVHLVGAVPILP